MLTRFLLELIQGILIGSGAILPGISGAALAVVFGVYEDFMDLVAHPLKNAKPFLARHASLCVGIAIGFIAFTFLLDRLFRDFTAPLVFLFSGFIAGTLPGIFRRARKKGVGVGEVAAFLATAGITIAIAITHRASGGILAAGSAGSPALEPGIPAWALAGAIVGTGSLLPGVSASFILIYLGLYGPLLDAVGALELPVALALGGGALAAVAVLSRAIDFLYHRFHGVVSFAVLGLTLGSLALVFPGVPSGAQLPISAALAIAGLAASILLDRDQG